MQLLGLDEVCELLKITVQTGRNRLSRGLPMPPSFRVGRRRLFVAAEVDRWLHEFAGVDQNVASQQVAGEDRPRGRPRKFGQGTPT